ncbi:hypothetical protein [Xanthomarina spongicola]|uniref:DUF2158 domain-containing protein n=1 Tax=Xanthomarina spongicola TaxID=570520 RepID=A0A316DPA0_9FLAO|nr:hypothetical protein [Xanthomarina spongicola]PWK19891.1 hypothetical protein LX78_01241 [Xanthomarina spongicola]
MTLRKFKPGDWVKIKGLPSNQKMEVLKYVIKKDPLLGITNSNKYLECVWYKNGERNSEIFHQNKLLKIHETGGLYKA